MIEDILGEISLQNIARSLFASEFKGRFRKERLEEDHPHEVMKLFHEFQLRIEEAIETAVAQYGVSQSDFHEMIVKYEFSEDLLVVSACSSLNGFLSLMRSEYDIEDSLSSEFKDFL